MNSAASQATRIMLIYPPMIYHPLQSRKTAIFPLGLGSIAAVLEPIAEVKLVDASLEGYDREEQLDDLIVYGMSEDEIAASVADFKPALLGVSGLFSSLHDQVIKVARAAKRGYPPTKVIAGGPHPSAMPEFLLKEKSLDYICVGEGEVLVPELIKRLKSNHSVHNIAGLVGRNHDGSIFGTGSRARMPDIESLPMPAWHLIGVDRYVNIGQTQGLRMDGSTPIKLVQMTTSRGCPNRCTYCGKFAVWGNKFRFASPEKVITEIETLVNRYGINRIAFQDDNLTANSKHIKSLLHMLIERKLPVTWEAHNGLEVRTLDPKLLDLMKESGCVSFTIAIESGSQAVLHRIKKSVDLDAACEVVKVGRDLGIDVRAFFIIGFPDETRQEIDDTRRFARKLSASVSAMAIYTPLPGSSIWDDLVAKGILDPDHMDFSKLSFGAFDVQLSQVPIEELSKIRKIDWLLNTFSDKDGNLKANLQVKPNIILHELQNGTKLFPEEKSIFSLFKQATQRYGNPEQ